MSRSNYLSTTKSALNRAHSDNKPTKLYYKESSRNSEQNPSVNYSKQNSRSNKIHSQIAIERWKLLKNAILNKESVFSNNSKYSIRRFNTFRLIKSVKHAYSNSLNNRSKSNRDENDDDDIVVNKKKSTTFDWYSVSVPSFDPEYNVNIRFYHSQVNIKDLAGFNNTGNICIWPSEEIMTFFCASLNSNSILSNKSVCELGGGMTCLAALMISKYSQPKEVFLTDGNEASYENLDVICNQNQFDCSVECCLLQWNKDLNYGDLENRFDFILCADCLFFDEFREDLCGTIYKLLKNDGTCLIFAPNRQNSFHKFVDMAKIKFECMIVNDYDLEVWEKHLNEKDNNPDYDEDIHYPLLLKLKKRTRSNNDFCKMVL